MRAKPNILITGTPGTGKSTLASAVASSCDFKNIPISSIVKGQQINSGWDEEFDCYIIDEDAEDKILDYLEPIMADGGVIIEHHSVDWFPERWFDLVIVLRTDNTILYDRLAKRDYSQHKITENVECEIMQVILEEARASYAPEIVVELQNDNQDQLEENLDRIVTWVENWYKDHNNQ